MITPRIKKVRHQSRKILLIFYTRNFHLWWSEVRDYYRFYFS